MNPKQINQSVKNDDGIEATPIEHVLNSKAPNTEKQAALVQLTQLGADLFTYATPSKRSQPENPSKPNQKPSIQATLEKYALQASSKAKSAEKNPAAASAEPTATASSKKQKELEAKNKIKQANEQLNRAINGGNLALLEKALKAGAEVNHWESRPLLKAVSKGNLKCLQRLLEQPSINVNIRDDYSYYTPLHVAAIRGDFLAAELLLNKGAATDLLSSDNETALDLAQFNRLHGNNNDTSYRKTMELLREHGAKSSALRTAANYGISAVGFTVVGTLNAADRAIDGISSIFSSRKETDPSA